MQRKWWTLTVASLATVMLLLDITVVNTALPRITLDLRSSFSDVQWVIDAYTLTLAAFVLTTGSLADRLGRRRLFTVGLVVFTAASGLCALSGSPLMLNVARGIQGFGGAILFAVSLALIAQEFRGRDRATAMSIYGASIGVGVAIGPLVGGLLTNSLGWRWIFYLNLPLGLITLLITVTQVSESRDPHARGIDWPGLVTFASANTLLVFALLRGNDDGWTSASILLMLAASAVLFIAFVVVQLRVSQPMLPLRFFRNRTFAGAQVAAFAISSSMFAGFLYITLYMQNVLGYSPLDASVRFLPVTLAAFFVAPVAAIAVNRIPPRALLGGGLALIAVGMLWISGVHEGDTWTALLGGLLIGGIGIGIFNPVLANIALSTVSENQSGVASGTNDTFRQLGISAGTAALGALFLARAESRITELLPGTGDAHQLAQGVSLGGLPPNAPHQIIAAARQGFLSGFSLIMVIGAVIAATGAILSLVLIRRSDLIVHEELAGEAVA